MRNLILALLAVVVAAALASVLMGGGDDTSASTSAVRQSSSAETRTAGTSLAIASDRVSGQCVAVEALAGPDEYAECQVRHALPGGTVAALGVARLAEGQPAVLPVTSGTGEHANAQGTVTLTLEPQGQVGQDVTVALELLTPR